jgi:hypothetical protein
MKKLIFIFLFCYGLTNKIVSAQKCKDVYRFDILSKKEVKKLRHLVHSGIPAKGVEEISINYQTGIPAKGVEEISINYQSRKLFFWKRIYKYQLIVDSKKIIVSETVYGELFISVSGQGTIVIDKDGLLRYSYGFSEHGQDGKVFEKPVLDFCDQKTANEVTFSLISSYVNMGNYASTLIQ